MPSTTIFCVPLLTRQVVEMLLEQKIQSVDAWAWQRQLRYYLPSGNPARLSMCNANFDYTYEVSIIVAMEFVAV